MKSSLFLILFIYLFSFCFCEKNNDFYDLREVTIEGDTITMNKYNFTHILSRFNELINIF